MKKTDLKTLLAILLMAVISVSLTACGDDKNDEPDTDYSSLVKGVWWTNAELFTDDEDEPWIVEEINFASSGKVTYMYTVDNIWGVIAEGNYSIDGNKITASYTSVSVYDKYGNSGTVVGFTDKKQKTVTYTIVSCNGQKLVIKDESRGITLTLTDRKLL